MKDYGEVPGGKSDLKHLLYPFHHSYPYKIWSKYRWFKNAYLKHLLPVLNRHKKWLTVVDRLGAPGDAIITANVIRCIKEQFPRLLINCITPNAELISLDPNIDSINKAETFYSFDSSYWELIVRKERRLNIIEHNINKLNLRNYNYKAEYYLAKQEKDWAKNEIKIFKKPLLAICTKSKEPVKNWPVANWLELIESLKCKFSILQLGDDREPNIEGVQRYAGKLSKRESAALLSCATLFIGPDSLLMHIANGLNIASVIIFGGSRPTKCFGYDQNINLSSYPNCSPCWIHKGYNECNENLKCLDEITVKQVISSVNRLLQK